MSAGKSDSPKGSAAATTTWDDETGELLITVSATLPTRTFERQVSFDTALPVLVHEHIDKESLLSISFSAKVETPPRGSNVVPDPATEPVGRLNPRTPDRHRRVTR